MNKKVSKIIIIVILIIVIGIGVYFFISSKGDTSSDKALKDAALDYFDKYVSVYSASSAYNITLKDLKEAEEDYNLKDYEGCNEEKTYVIVTINNTNGKVIKTEIKKNC